MTNVRAGILYGMIDSADTVLSSIADYISGNPDADKDCKYTDYEIMQAVSNARESLLSIRHGLYAAYDDTPGDDNG